MKRIVVFLFSVFLFYNSWADDAKEKDNKKTRVPASRILRQGNYLARQLVTPTFEYLPLDRKIFAYHLYNASVASHEILWTQLSPDGRAVRDLFEIIWNYSSVLEPTVKSAISEYLFLLYANTGNYDKFTNQKFTLKLSQEKFTEVVREIGKSLSENEKESFLREAERLQRLVIDPEYLKVWQAQSPSDKISGSSSGFYGSGITEEVLKNFPEELSRNLSNYPMMDDFGRVQFVPQRIGARFSVDLLTVDHHLGLASEYANPEEKEIISAYRQYYRTGSAADLKTAEILWTKYKPADIDFMFSFVEAYDDPLKFRGAWEAFVLLMDISPETIERVRNIRANATYFEAQMPVDEQYKKTGNFEPPKAEGAFLVFGEGRSGRRSWSGKNLPNDSTITNEFGSKSYTANNIMFNIGDKSLVGFNPKQYPEKYRKNTFFSVALYRKIQVEFHEIVGHGSGRLLENVKDSDLREMYSPVEEARAETASLYHLTDARLSELGIVAGLKPAQVAIFAEMAISTFFAEQIRKYSKLKEDATQIRQAHMWGGQLMLNYLLSQGAIEVITGKEGYPLVDITDMELARKSLGEVWARLQKVRSEGSYEEAKAFFEEYGQYQDRHREWRKQVVAAQSKANVAKEVITLSPSLKTIKDSKGNITDVRIVYSRAKHLDDIVERERRLTQTSKEMIKEFMCMGLFI